jgi:hypothetical protein
MMVTSGEWEPARNKIDNHTPELNQAKLKNKKGTETEQKQGV